MYITNFRGKFFYIENSCTNKLTKSGQAHMRLLKTMYLMIISFECVPLANILKKSDLDLGSLKIMHYLLTSVTMRSNMTASKSAGFYQQRHLVCSKLEEDRLILLEKDL